MGQSFDLDRFVAAQDPVYEQVKAELKNGRKTSHWMWFVFPQLAGLAGSDMSKRYAISSLDEARAYLAHPVLGMRLREAAALVLETKGKSAGEIFGHPDDLKFQSCMTLFRHAAPEDTETLFRDALARFYGGKEDAHTAAALEAEQKM
ncbi:MAG TPA: DUF1810 domain-containing protein [Rhizomicrobium sp.]|jgi:uncharacterized protein (DUF1810 family)